MKVAALVILVLGCIPSGPMWAGEQMFQDQDAVMLAGVGCSQIWQGRDLWPVEPSTGGYVDCEARVGDQATIYYTIHNGQRVFQGMDVYGRPPDR